ERLVGNGKEWIWNGLYEPAVLVCHLRTLHLLLRYYRYLLSAAGRNNVQLYVSTPGLQGLAQLRQGDLHGALHRRRALDLLADHVDQPLTLSPALGRLQQHVAVESHGELPAERNLRFEILGPQILGFAPCQQQRADLAVPGPKRDDDEAADLQRGEDGLGR